jgi:hypothetical protein
MINIRSDYLLPWPFRLVGLLAIFLGIATIHLNPWISAVLVIVSLFSIPLHEGTDVDPVRKQYREYIAWFFIKTGSFLKYPGIESVFITRSKEKQQLYTAHTTHSSVFENVFYNAYLKFSHGEKIHLQKAKDKNKLLQRIKPLTDALTVDVIDYS